MGTLALAVALPTSSEAQSGPGTDDTARALSIQYADGRTTIRVLRPSGGMWTPFFPRVAGVESVKGGLSVTALDVRHRVDGRDVIVTVSLLYGSPHQRREHVSTVRVTPDAPLRVDDLHAYGVEPVTLALVPVPAVVSTVPAVISPSGGLDIRVEPIAPGVPAYRVMISNDSPHALMAIDFDGYLGEKRVLSGRRKDGRNRPLVEPQAKYQFELTMSSGGDDSRAGSRAGWRSLDRLVVTSVMWADGIVEGDSAPAAQERWLNEDKARQIERVIAVLRRAGGQGIAALRSDIGALGIDSSIGMRQVKDAALTDVDAFANGRRDPQSAAFEEWRAMTILEYERWLTRVTRVDR